MKLETRVCKTGNVIIVVIQYLQTHSYVFFSTGLNMAYRRNITYYSYPGNNQLLQMFISLLAAIEEFVLNFFLSVY